MNSSGKTSQGQQGACGGQLEEAEDEESSSSSSLSSVLVEDELENFRQKWKQDLANKNLALKNSLDADGNELVSTEEKARLIFLEGVEHEQNGELFEAIQKYRKAINLVPDIEFKAFEHNTKRRQGQSAQAKESLGDEATDEEIEDIPETEEEDVDLLLKFSRMKIKSAGLCQEDKESNVCHISRLPMEVLIQILQWVVSADLDLRSLENFSRVCRGFFVASRASDIWRKVCIQTWGLAGLPLEEPGLGGWRTLFLTRPRVNFDGCYISRVTYLREGERGFQDNEFYKSWHVVHYHRIIRFFPGGQVLMVLTAEEPAIAVKLLNNRYSCAIQGCMFGHYRTINNIVHCIMHKAKLATSNNLEHKRRFSLKQRKARNPYVFEVPKQDFHIELEINGKRNQKLHWCRYNIISKYNNGQETKAEQDITNLNNYPMMQFSRVKSYTLDSVQPLI